MLIPPIANRNRAGENGVMTHWYSTFAITLVLSVMAATASAQDATPLATPEAATLQDFGVKTVSCVEWNDGCATCLRDAAGLAHCSTPGIACQPREIACVKMKP